MTHVSGTSSALQAEVVKLKEENARLLVDAWAERDAAIEEREELRAEGKFLAEEGARLLAERDRLRAVLEEVEKQCDLCHGTGGYEPPCDRCRDSTDDHVCEDNDMVCPRPIHAAALRAKAGLP